MANPAHSQPRSSLRQGLSALTTALLLCACDSGGGGSGSAPMELVEVSHGFGLLVPHQVHRADEAGEPTNELIAIRTQNDLISNVTLANPVLPVTEWPAETVLPNGDQGNHYIYAQFTQPIGVDSVLSPSPNSLGSFGLAGALNVVAVDPASGLTSPVPGRGFIGGRTYIDKGGASMELQQWVTLDDAGNAIANDVGGEFPGQGFPGTDSSGFSGATKMLSDTTFVFVADSDGDLSTYESFPPNRQIQLRATSSVLSNIGNGLEDQVLGGSTVGIDTLAPEVALTPAPNSVPLTVPAFGDSDVDPATDIQITFTESVQPLTVGPLPSNSPPALSTAITISFGPQISQTKVPFTALPVSVYDFSTWVLTPTFAFPGSGPVFAQCGTFNEVSMNVVPGQIQDLATVAPPATGGNRNTLPAATSFTTGEGPGLVNAPVVPDAIYAIRGKTSSPGISVIDLNGFGQSTGDPTFDGTYAKGHSNFRNNPNLLQQGTAIHPAIFPGTCTIDGGSSGVFSLTRDSSLNSLLITNPLITSAGDAMIGHPLDLVYNNAKDATGCQAGGGNVCAINGLKQIQVSFGFAGVNTMTVPGNLPNQPIVGNANLVQAGGNPVSWAPHPNPPALIFPPLCVQPYIGGQEPTSFYTIELPINGGLGLKNLLNPGDPLGDPNNGLPPSGLLTQLQNMYFEGPDRASLPLAACMQHMMRQQVGHFLYMIDRARREIVVINSNRFQVLDRIPVSDPTNLAMSPNLDLLAVSNQNSDLVQFIDIDPNSGTFHQVVKNTAVGRGPRGIAWDPANEDILVCNELDNSMSIISAHTLAVRKEVKSQLNLPFDVVITQRQNGFGFLRNVYFAWILNRNGDLAIFESGPSGLNGWGYDDVIGVAPMQFENPKTLAVDFSNLGGGCWVVHENQLGADGQPTGQVGGAISNVVIAATTFGQLTLVNANFFVNPQFRDMDIKVQSSIGSDQLTGIPVDIAQDDQINFGSLSNFEGVLNNYSAGVPAAINGKSYVRMVNNVPTGAKHPRFLFAAVPNSSEGPGVVDVINLQSSNLRFDTDPYEIGKQSIPVPNVTMVIDYWRQ